MDGSWYKFIFYLCLFAAFFIILKCSESQNGMMSINQTDTFTAMEISDGFLTYHYSSEMQGELLDYVMSNRDLLYDNAMSNIVSNPAALFTSAL